MFVTRMILLWNCIFILPLCLSKYINRVFLILMPICFYMWLLVIFLKSVLYSLFPLIWKIFAQSQHISSNLVSGKTLKTPFFSNHVIFIFCDKLVFFENVLFQSLVIIFSFEQVWVHKCQNESYPVVCFKHNHFSIHF